MNLEDLILLGFLQGLTEFLPISSSGHLVIGEWLLGMDAPGVSIEVALHVGTLLAAAFWLRREVGLVLAEAWDLVRGRPRNPDGWLIPVLVGSVPAAVLGLAGKARIEEAFGSLQAAGWGLLATGVILVAGRARGSLERVALPTALIIGFAQAAALWPGISRSGATIVAGMVMGLSGPTAARFSFLLMLPAVGGAALLQLGGLPSAAGAVPGMGLAAAIAVSAVVGFLCVRWVGRLVEARGLAGFAPYCLGLGALILLETVHW